jgi:TATA-binding protein-associated factor Taf7
MNYGKGRPYGHREFEPRDTKNRIITEEEAMREHVEHGGSFTTKEAAQKAARLLGMSSASVTNRKGGTRKMRRQLRRQGLDEVEVNVDDLLEVINRERAVSDVDQKANRGRMIRRILDDNEQVVVDVNDLIYAKGLIDGGR